MNVILGSRSPQRRELLGWLVEGSRLTIRPPSSSDEPPFDDLNHDDAIEKQLREIVMLKFDDVARQVGESPPEEFDGTNCIVCADTVVVADSREGRRVVLGQPDHYGGDDQVRQWFGEYLSGKVHEVWTCFQAGNPRDSAERPVYQEVVKSIVRLEELDRELIDWYISTGEFRGKAGGYAIQGQASVFVKELQGSLTNVIGLPMMEVARALKKLGVPLRKGDVR